MFEFFCFVNSDRVESYRKIKCQLLSFSVSEEERLSEVVRNYPILYDKTQKGYKERDAVENAWNEVSTLLDFVQSGSLAKNSFENFKKRHLKERNPYKKAQKSETSTAAVEKAKTD